MKNFKVDRNKRTRGLSVFERSNNTRRETKTDRLMSGVGLWCSFYRLFPHVFVEEYMGITLKFFQQILIYFMMHYNYFMYLASRGQGKSFLTAIFCCVRAILFPESKIIVASGQKSQAREIIEKIDDMRKTSPNLDREISYLSTNTNDARVEFHNGSWIKIVASNDGARSKRSNVLIVDEFRMVDLDILNKVLRKFQTAPRQPKYLDKPEYAHLKERNKELYLSSCWYKSHWSWVKVKAFMKAMTGGKKYFLCGLPYQLAIKENLLDEEQVEDEMAEDDFDEIGFSMEMECLFFGESESAYFKLADLNDNRVLSDVIYPREYYNILKDSKFKYTPKKENRIRFVSCDIALMKGKANDASCYTIFELKPSGTNYVRNVVYMESMTGGHTVTQAIRIRQLFEDYECDYIVLDTLGVGLGVYDQLCISLYDKDRKKEYEAISCMNDEKMADRCIDDDAPKIIYSVKGNPQFNSDCATTLRDALRRNKIKFPINENDIRFSMRNLKGYSKLSAEDKVKLEIPYKQITLFINETINLSNEGVGQVVKLVEPRNGRKDRYSSITYGNYFAKYLENTILRVFEEDIDFANMTSCVSSLEIKL